MVWIGVIFLVIGFSSLAGVKKDTGYRIDDATVHKVEKRPFDGLIHLGLGAIFLYFGMD